MKKGKKIKTRDSSPKSSAVAFLLSDAANELFCPPGYTRLSQCPEVVMAVNKIASLIGSMTIQLFENTGSGDVRVKNELSRKIDIEPNRYMTRMTLMTAIIRTLLLDGGGNAVAIPRTSRGYLDSIDLVPAGRASFVPDTTGGYLIGIDGVLYDPEALLHFVLNPDPEMPWKGSGVRIALSDVANNLKQAAETKKGFLQDKWKPSLIIKVDSFAEELQTEAGRERFLEKYVKSSKAGTPWLVPSDAQGIQIEQIRPLTLNDLAINDSVTVDKKTVAAILGVPPYVVGAGEFKRDEWNAFVNNTILPIAREIEQELTRKLLYSEKLFFRLNPWALYSYDVQQLANIGSELYVRGIMTGNEVRDWLGKGPKEGLDNLVILENFIPASMIGDQEKLNKAGAEGSE